MWAIPGLRDQCSQRDGEQRESRHYFEPDGEVHHRRMPRHRGQALPFTLSLQPAAVRFHLVPFAVLRALRG